MREKMNKILILVSGKKQSGKDQLATYMAECLRGHGKTVGFEKISQRMKDWTAEDFLPVADYLNGVAGQLDNFLKIFTDIRNPILPTAAYGQFVETINKIKLLPSNFYENKTDLSRMLLQIYGTSIIQNRVDTNYWDSITKKAVEGNNKVITFVTDVRFPSNVDSLSDSALWSTYVIRVNRKGFGSASDHISETALDKYKLWNYVVENEGTLDNLKSAAKNIVKDIIEVGSL